MSVDFCSDCLVTQVLSSDRHSLDHKFIGLRVSSEVQSQSDEDDDNDDDGENNDDLCMSDDQNISNTFDKDFISNNFV